MGFPPPVHLGPAEAAAVAADQYLNFADATEIGSSGKVTDEADDVLALTIDNGTAAATASEGISGMIGGCYWDLGAVLKGSVNIALEWVQQINQSSVVLSIWRDTAAPTSLQDIEDATAHWAQARWHSGGNVSTFTREGTTALQTGVAENQAGSERLHVSLGIDDNGIGPMALKHEHGATSTSRTDATVTAKTSGNWYAALTFCKLGASAGSEEVIKVKARGGMPA